MDAIATSLDEGDATTRDSLAERQVVITWYGKGEVETATRDVPEHALTAIREGTPEIFILKSKILMLLNGHWPRFGRVTATIRSPGTEHTTLTSARFAESHRRRTGRRGCENVRS